MGAWWGLRGGFLGLSEGINHDAAKYPGHGAVGAVAEFFQLGDVLWFQSARNRDRHGRSPCVGRWVVMGSPSWFVNASVVAVIGH